MSNYLCADSSEETLTQVELSYKAVEVAVLEVEWKYLLGKLGVVMDNERLTHLRRRRRRT